MLAQLPRYRDTDLQLGEVDVTEMREFFQRWVAELRSRDGR